MSNKVVDIESKKKEGWTEKGRSGDEGRGKPIGRKEMEDGAYEAAFKILKAIRDGTLEGVSVAIATQIEDRLLLETHYLMPQSLSKQTSEMFQELADTYRTPD